MKYDFYYRKLEAFWGNYKTWIIGALILIVAVGTVAEFWPKSPEGRIKSTLIDYHKAKGQNVEFQSLSFFSVSAAYPDSMLLKQIDQRINYFKHWYGQWSDTRQDAFATKLRIEYGVSKSDTALVNAAQNAYQSADTNKQEMYDSLMIMYDSFGTVQKTIEFKKDKYPSLTKCEYIAKVTSHTESFVDTFTVILNDSLRVVWPTKK